MALIGAFAPIRPGARPTCVVAAAAANGWPPRRLGSLRGLTTGKSLHVSPYLICSTMSAHSSDDDHNYYTRANRRSQIPDYDVNPESSAAAAAATAAPSSLQTLPAYAYRQSQEYLAKRPKISTTFDRAPPAVSRVTTRHRLPDDSPDPHDFYSRYRDSFIRQSGSVYESLDTFGEANGGDTSAGGGHDGMASASTSQLATPQTARSNGFVVTPLSARWNGRLDAESTPSPMTEKISPGGSRTNPPPTYLPRSRQTSLQALVNKFNQTPDEVPPVPRKPGSRSTSESRSPSNYTSAASFRSRASPDASHASQPSHHAHRHRPADAGRKESTGTRSSAKRHHATDRGPPPVKSPRSSRRSSAMSTHSAATQSMNDLSQSTFGSSKPPLFGEVVGNAQATLDPGYGIPRPRRRRGSEGSMHYPNAMFADDPGAANAGLEPPSPTAWYKGVTPSLDGIDLDHPIPPKPVGLHRRSRSDMSSHAFTIAPLASSMGKSITILSPPQEQPSPSPSPTSVRRHSQSRIPVSARRPSVASESSASGPSTRAPSAASHYATHKKAHGKNRSGIAVAIQAITPDHTAARSSTPRKSPRRRPPSPSRQPSPRLQAYISEAAPAKSPPLRSSRPRQSVSSATTSASRARAAATMVEPHATAKPKERPSRRMPEVGTVDFAARRQRIQQAFTKSMIETEQEEERKRMSILHDSQLMQRLESQPPLPDAPRLVEASNLGSPKQQSERQSSLEETYATPAEDFTEQQRGLTVDTTKPPEKPTLVISQEDSPTLGNATFVDPTREPDESSEEQEPMSAVTAGTTETFFDHEPQDSDEKEEPEHTPVAPPLEVIPDSRHSAISSSPQSARRQLQSYNTDHDEVGSIRIMLGDTPLDDRANEMGTLSEQVGELVDELGQGWGAEERRTPEERSEEPSEEQTPVRRPTNDSQASESTAHEYYGSPLWSPGSAGTLLTGNTLDSDSYNTISRVLDSYSDPSLMSPENISEFQQRLFSQSPDLARKGGWDTKKVTQLYLQGLRNKVAGSAVPNPLQFEAPRDAPASPVVEPPEPAPEHHEGRRVDFESDEAEEDRTPANEQARTSVGLGVPAKILNRASLNNPDDWANTSPSMLDWFHRQATESSSIDDEKPATPQIAEPDFDLVQTPRGDRPLLPDIPRGGLGILDLPADGPTERRGSPYRSAQKGSPVSPSRKPLPAVVEDRGKSPAKPPADVHVKVQPLEEPRPTVDVPRPITPATAKPKPDEPSAAQDSTRPDKAPSTAAEATPKAAAVSAELQKKLTRRRHIVKELVDTESSFGQDMTVVVDIYKGTSNVILNSPEDVKTLFGNAHDIVAFSMRFLDSLKNAAKAVYVLPKSKRWRSKRDSSATTESRDTDDQASIGGLDLNDEDRDRLTTIGAVFLDHVADMEKVYAEYLKNHDAANQKLQQLQKTQKVQIWLKECQTYASDLTTAWDLDSLLVKPVQRILKYSLFLKDLLEVTPENHPDFVKIDTATREMIGVSKRINDAKKRADLIEQVTQPSRGKDKRKENESSRLAITKRFNLRPDKFKPPLGLVDLYQDRDYNAVSDKFGSHFFQLQVVMRDVEMYVEEVQAWVARFHEMVAAVKAYNDVAQTTYPEVESKWRLFQQSMHELQMTALTDHVAAVRKSVIEPMTTLLKLHDGPQKLMEKRKKRVAEFAKYKSLKDRGEKADKKTTEQGEQFLAINETLKEELPRLFILTGKLVEACLNNFVQLQLQWQSVWKRKMIQAIELQEVPRSFDSVLEAFAGDFRYPEAQVLSLGICNGSLLADAANLVNLLTPSSTLDEDSLRRPSGPMDARTGTYGEEFRPRAQSYTSNETVRTRGLSGPIGGSSGSGVSPMLPAPDLGRPTESLGLGPHFAPPPTSAPNHAPASRNRLRASSNASSKSPSTPDMPGAWRTSGHSPSGFGGGGGYAARPSTSTGRGYEQLHHQRLDGQRHSSEAAHGRLRADLPENVRHMPPPPPHAAAGSAHYASHSQANQHQLQQQLQQHHPQRYSGVFSSAMPMSDSPPGEPDPSASQPPADGQPVPTAFNVLFLAASVYEFNIDRDRREAGYPYLTYVAGEVR